MNKRIHPYLFGSVTIWRYFVVVRIGKLQIYLLLSFPFAPIRLDLMLAEMNPKQYVVLESEIFDIVGNGVVQNLSGCCCLNQKFFGDELRVVCDFGNFHVLHVHEIFL